MPPSKPRPNLQVGSPRSRRTVLDDKVFEEVSARADKLPGDEPSSPRAAQLEEAPTPDDSRSSGANRKGKTGEPYVRGDGVATVPQYLTLPADLVKRLKIHAVETNRKVSEVATEALAAYLDGR